MTMTVGAVMGVMVVVVVLVTAVLVLGMVLAAVKVVMVVTVVIAVMIVTVVMRLSQWGYGGRGGGRSANNAAWHRVKALNLEPEDLYLRGSRGPSLLGRELWPENIMQVLFCLVCFCLCGCLCVCRLWMANPFLAPPPTSTPPD